MAETQFGKSMVICFTGDNGSIWDIARKYNASIDEIIEINDLNDIKTHDTNMILVPIN